MSAIAVDEQIALVRRGEVGREEEETEGQE